MRSHGLLFIFSGIIVLVLFWNEYFTNISKIIELGKFYVDIILLIGMVITLLGGLTIGVGLKILIDPEFYERLKSLIKE